MLSPCNRGLEGGAAARGARGAQGTHDLQIAALGSDVERRATIGSRRIGVGARACE